VTAKDTTPPTLMNVPKDLVLEATSAKGAVATLPLHDPQPDGGVLGRRDLSYYR
jgi:hypothetical protein